MNLTSLAIAFFCLSLTGCASIVSGHNQSVSVVARSAETDVVGARCSLTNDKGQWYATTPGSVTVRRSYAAMAIDCKNDRMAGTVQVKSSTKAMAFGNIIFGGVIGVGVDVATGAAYDYPELISVNLVDGGPALASPALLPMATSAALPVAAAPVEAPAPAVAVVVVSSPAPAPITVAKASEPGPLRTAVALAAPAPKGGQDFHNVRKLAQSMQCNDSASPVLMAKNPGSELYSLTCTSGLVLAVQCDFGNCRALK